MVKNTNKQKTLSLQKSCTALIARCKVSRGEFCDVSMKGQNHGRTDRSI